MYELLLEIEDLPKTTNSIGRLHWAIKAREARKWKNYIHLYAGSNKPSKPLQKAKLTLVRYSSKSPDPDGLVSSFKHVIDGLVEAGILIDDNYDVIGMPKYLWSKVKAKEGKITVLVEESNEDKEI